MPGMMVEKVKTVRYRRNRLLEITFSDALVKYLDLLQSCQCLDGVSKTDALTSAGAFRGRRERLSAEIF